MKKIPLILFIGLVVFTLLQCDKTHPFKPDTTRPEYWFPKGENYNWLYVTIGQDCIATDDTFSISYTGKNDRYIDEVKYSGWDMVSSPGGDTSFYYLISDTIFFKKDPHLSLPPYHILVGPIEAGKFWKDRSPYNFDYSIVGFEDLYSPVAGITFSHCVKIKRTSPDDNKTKYYWWSSVYGRVKEVDFQSEQCLGG